MSDYILTAGQQSDVSDKIYSCNTLVHKLKLKCIIYNILCHACNTAIPTLLYSGQWAHTFVLIVGTYVILYSSLSHFGSNYDEQWTKQVSSGVI